MRKSIPLNFDWKYSPVYQDEMMKKGYDDAAFETVQIPHTNLQLPLHYFDEKSYQFVSCYRKHFKLPMYEYMNNVLAKWTPHIRFVTIYDQLNPAYAKYYTQAEVVDLMSRAGFKNIRLYHRHGYSWTVVGDRE